MATVKRLKVTRWYAPDGREVKAGTPGAMKWTEEGSTFFIVYKEGGKTKRVATGLTDKTAAQTYLANWHKARERGDVGLTDPFKPHLDAPLQDHLQAYLQSKTAKTEKHRREIERELQRLFNATGMKALRDMTPERIHKYLTDSKAGVVTRKRIRTYLHGFDKWLVRLSRIPASVIDRVPVPEERPDDKPPRVRRAYGVSELQRLLNAAREYPLLTRTFNRGGRPRRDGKPLQYKPVIIPDAERDTLTARGKERELMYRVMLATGLRRGETSRLTVSMFDAARNRLVVPTRVCKVKPKHVKEYVFDLPPALSSDLQAHVIGKTPADKLLKMPHLNNTVKEHTARLKLAGIDYMNDKGAADVHALRTTANLLLKRKGVSLDERQLFMRHAASDITTKHYDPDSRRQRTMTARVRRLMSALDSKIVQPPTPTP